MIELVNTSSTDKKSRTQSFLQLSLIHHLFIRFVFLFFCFFVYLSKVQSRLQSLSLLRMTTDEKS